MSESLIYKTHGTKPGESISLDGKWDGLTFRKQLIYVDAFHKKNKTHDQPFTITEEDLEHFDITTNEMISNGVKVPTPIKHTTDPEQGRGQVLRVERGIDDKGRPSLYGIVRFRDKEAAKMANSTDVSIFVPDEIVYDGKGRPYKRPVRHVCFTDYPVIPDLEGFKAIAASLVENLELSVWTGSSFKPIKILRKAGPKIKSSGVVKATAKVAAKKGSGLVGFAKHTAAGIAVGHVTGKVGGAIGHAVGGEAGGQTGHVVGELGGHLLGGSLLHHLKPKHLKSLAGFAARAATKIHPAIAGAAIVGIGAHQLLKRKDKTLSLSTELAKHSSFGLKHRSVRDYLGMRFGKAGQAAARIGVRTVKRAKGLLKNPLVATVGVNEASKRYRGDKENKFIESYGAVHATKASVGHAKRFIHNAQIYDKAMNAASNGGVHAKYFTALAKQHAGNAGVNAIVGTATALTGAWLIKSLLKKKPIAASLELDSVKHYDTDPSNVKARIGGRFAPSPESNAAKRKVRGNIRETNRATNLLFRDKHGNVNPNPTIDSALHNVQNNFHELLHVGADSGTGPLHAIKHASVAGITTGIAVGGLHQTYKHGQAIVTRAKRAAMSTMRRTKTPGENVAARVSVKAANRASATMAQVMGKPAVDGMSTATKIPKAWKTKVHLKSVAKALKDSNANHAKMRASAIAKLKPTGNRILKAVIAGAKSFASKHTLGTAKHIGHLSKVGAAAGTAAVAIHVAKQHLKATKKAIAE